MESPCKLITQTTTMGYVAKSVILPFFCEYLTHPCAESWLRLGDVPTQGGILIFCLVDKFHYNFAAWTSGAI